MTLNRDLDYLTGLVRELCKLPTETEWAEFKHNNDNPTMIGEYISALSNSAAIAGKNSAYIVWGIDNESHDIIGTTFAPSRAKKGNENLENWLLRMLSPRIHFSFHEFEVDSFPVVIMEIEKAFREPVQFSGTEYIRVGSHKKKLKDHPEKERDLWRVFDDTPFEDLVAKENVSKDDVLRLLDYSAYFELLDLSVPEGHDKIIGILSDDRMITPCETGNWNITNLGAVLFAKSLSDFRGLERKAVRVILYRGNGRVDTIREQIASKGYANGFEGLIGFINNLLPSNEVIGQALRKNVPMYPELAVRELVANALIHQDFFITGAGPLIEIFDTRMEVTNPGEPLVDTERFLNSPPRSRNEALASFMRRIGVCEERGTGVDKVVSQAEVYQLPAPAFESPEDNTRAVLFSHRPMREMNKEERIRACYLHACLRFSLREDMTNTTLRERFGVEAKNSAQISVIIRHTIEAGKIRPYDESAGKKAMRYLPFWA